MGDPGARTPALVYPGLLLVAAATLTLEVCLTRVLSVALWYHFAFMVVSTALFGLGFAFFLPGTALLIVLFQRSNWCALMLSISRCGFLISVSGRKVCSACCSVRPKWDWGDA